MSCGAKGGKSLCCPGLVCHAYQFWRCVKDEYKTCSGLNACSSQCESKYKLAAPECCSGLVCNDNKKCTTSAVSITSIAEANAPAKCAKENQASKECGSNWNQARSECCSRLVCNENKRCVSASLWIK